MTASLTQIWRSELHALLRAVYEFLFALSTFPLRFGKILYKRFAHDAVMHFLSFMKINLGRR